MLNVFLEALIDTLKILPFLILIYIIIELIEHKTTVFGNRKILQGNLAPLIGSAVGLVPLWLFRYGGKTVRKEVYPHGHVALGIYCHFGRGGNFIIVRRNPRAFAHGGFAAYHSKIPSRACRGLCGKRPSFQGKGALSPTIRPIHAILLRARTFRRLAL